jgi:uncharacterized protein (DUF2267 family)
MQTTQTPIQERNRSFLETVMKRGNLQDLYEARDLTEIVYRTMRDLLDGETIDRVTDEMTAPRQPGQDMVADLWKDTNPIVGWLSRVRPPFSKEAPLGIDDNLFLRRIEQEGGMPRNTDPITVVKAVFVATKAELSETRRQEIAASLPGIIKTMWETA